MRKKFSTLRRCVFALVFVLAIAGTLVLALTNNGSDDVFYEITITRGHTLEGVLPVAPHIDGYIFMYWSTTPQGGPANINMPLNYDTSLYAVWRIQDDPVGGIEEFAYGGHLNDQTWEEYQQEHYYGHAVARYTHYDSNDYYHYTAGDGYDYYYDPAPTRMYAYGYEHGYSYYHHDLSDSLDHEYNYYTNYHYDYNNTWDETIVIRFLEPWRTVRTSKSRTASNTRAASNNARANHTFRRGHINCRLLSGKHYCVPSNGLHGHPG